MELEVKFRNSTRTLTSLASFVIMSSLNFMKMLKASAKQLRLVGRGTRKMIKRNEKRFKKLIS